MDLNSWRPEDTARRFSLMVASSLGTFTFIALWLAAGWNPLLALIGAALAGLLVHLIAYRLLLLVFRR